MFQIKIGMKDVGECATFIEAFKRFFPEVVEQYKNSRDLGWLETTNLIIYRAATGDVNLAIGFYDARDLAYEIGLLVGEGEFQDISRYSEDVIVAAFRKVGQDYLQDQTQKLVGVLEGVSEVLG